MGSKLSHNDKRDKRYSTHEPGPYVLDARGTEIVGANFKSQGDCDSRKAVCFEDGEGLTIARGKDLGDRLRYDGL